MKDINQLIDNDWGYVLKDDLNKKSFNRLIQVITNERRNHTVFPSKENIFTAFNLSPFSKTKIVILGQDPYHGKGQAHGLSFSVPEGQKIPPSLRNIFKELQSDLQIPVTKNGNLRKWAQQGILLLNSILTVREKEAGSHKNLGWEQLTDAVISKLSLEKNGLIFMLWGAFAQSKISLINTEKHHILRTSHPSPLSAYKGFLGCRHFSKTNEILIKNNHTPIDWKLCSENLTLF